MSTTLHVITALIIFITTTYVYKFVYATGDLMGDIINVAVVKGDNLFESSVLDAEEVIGNLAPAVHALLYLNQSGFMTPEVEVKGRAHVTHGM